jgi:hypothetical protein
METHSPSESDPIGTFSLRASNRPNASWSAIANVEARSGGFGKLRTCIYGESKEARFHYFLIMICHLDRFFYTLTGITHQQRSIGDFK